MSELRSHPHLTLAEHLAQIREAARAIWGRHSRKLFDSSREACSWFVDGVTFHDAGKASQAFQEYIPAPEKYRGSREGKAHTPLSAVCVLHHAQREGWHWRRALAVALIAAGHHSEFKTHKELDDAICTMDHVINNQVGTLDWNALDRAIGVVVSFPKEMDGIDLCVNASNVLEEFVDKLHALELYEAIAYRLLCQLAFSVLLEADKAFLAIPSIDVPKYSAPRKARIPARLVEDFIAAKPNTSINTIRTEARSAMFKGMASNGGRRLQTMTLPTGTGKTLLAASWALTLRERIAKEEGQPPLVLIVLPYLAIIDQTAKEYMELFRSHIEPGEMITYHSLSDRTFAPDLEEESQDFFLDTWQSDVVITTLDQFLFALLAPKSRHQMRFHHLADALIVLDEVQVLPCILWDPLQKALDGLTKLGTTHVLAMSATQPGFLNAPHELIAAGTEFFMKMSRYRIVLRHHTPMKLGDFISECKESMRDWSGKRILITLNTRRSARQVLDELKAFIPDGMALEFISADVTPKDRLAVIDRIKKNEPCLVVSTQCIEAGVDIDMDLVIRDFATLDNIIQIAGRCNRNGRRERGTVEIVLLENDESRRSFSGMIYDRILLQITRQILGNREEINEESIFPLTKDYFARLPREKDTGEDETRHWYRWEEMTTVRKLLRGAQRPQHSFIVIENDPSLRNELEALLLIQDRWVRRRTLKTLARRIAENTVNIYQTETLNPENYADPFPANANQDEEWFWLLRKGHYTTLRGLDLNGQEGDQETLGISII